MAIKKNKAPLVALHDKANTLVVAYQKENDPVLKEFILKDLLDICEDMVNHNCNKFNNLYSNNYGVDFEEIKALAVGLALIKALKSYEAGRGNFLGHWEIIIQRTVINEVNRRRTHKQKANYYAISGNAVVAADFTREYEVFDFIADDDSDFEENSCVKMTYFNLVDEFSQKEKHGELMRYELLTDQERKQMTLAYFNETEYSSTVRMRVLRTRKKFEEFLKSKGYNYKVS